MTGYRIRCLNEWAPDDPPLSCPDIDDAIRSMEKVRSINDDLRAAFGQAIDYIETLDRMVMELQGDLDARQADLQASDEIISKLENRVEELNYGFEEALKENEELKDRVEVLLDRIYSLEQELNAKEALV